MAVRDFSQTDLILTERKRFERRMLVMVWLGVTTLSIIHMNPFYLLAGTVVFAVNFWAVSKQKEIYLAKSQVNSAIIFASLILLLEVFIGGEFPIIALSHYLILIQLCKLFEKKTNRDYVQIMILSAILMIAGALECNTLWFIITLIVYVFMLCRTISVFILKKDLDNAADEHLFKADSVMSPQQLAWCVNADWPFKTLRRHIGFIFITILLTGAVTFIFAPRGEGGSDLRFLGQSRGWGSFLELGKLDSIYLSDRIIMKIDDGSKGDLLGGYLRGKVFYDYSKSKWMRYSKSRLIDVTKPGQSILAKAKTYEVFMVPDFIPILFAPENTVYIESAGKDVKNIDGCWSFKKNMMIDQAARYKIYTLGSSIQIPPQAIRYHDLPAPDETWDRQIFIHPKVRELAMDWCDDLSERRANTTSQPSIDSFNQRIAMRIRQKLRENYEYTLDLSDSDPSRDSVEDFLFSMKKGHCEYFATTMTLMCRSMGIPARLVTGFYITNLEKQDNNILLRERDAHAWCEVYSPSLKKWIVFDATPIPTATKKPRVNRWKKINQLWSVTKFQWYEKVTKYDTMIRSAIAQWTKTRIKNALSACGSWLKSAGEFFFRDTFGKILLPFAILIPSLGLAIVVYLLIRMIGDLLGFGKQEQIANEENSTWRKLHFTRQLFGIFHEHGFPHWPEQSLRSWAMEAAFELDLPMDTVKDLVNLYYSIRWGKTKTTSQQLKSAQQQVEKLGQLISQRKEAQNQPPAE